MLYNLIILDEGFISGLWSSSLNITFILSVICSICVITTKNPIVSVLYLIGLFLVVACYLIMLGMSFIGLSYLLVYVGAVSILFLFILMLINVRISELVTDNNNSIPLSIIIVSVFNIVLFDILNPGNLNNSRLYLSKDNLQDLQDTNDITGHELSKSFVETIYNSKEIGSLSLHNYYDNNAYLVTSSSWDTALSQTSHIATIGNVIYTTYPMLLILISIILLLSMVGAIVITIKQ